MKKAAAKAERAAEKVVKKAAAKVVERAVVKVAVERLAGDFLCLKGVREWLVLLHYHQMGEKQAC